MKLSKQLMFNAIVDSFYKDIAFYITDYAAINTKKKPKRKLKAKTAAWWKVIIQEFCISELKKQRKNRKTEDKEWDEMSDPISEHVDFYPDVIIIFNQTQIQLDKKEEIYLGDFLEYFFDDYSFYSEQLFFVLETNLYFQNYVFQKSLL